MPVNEQLQNKMIQAMIVHMGVVTTAAKSIDIARSTHYEWMENDPAYKQKIIDLREVKKDFVESKLMKLVEQGDTAATIFSAKTLLKDRGYVERQEITGADGKAVINELHVKIIRDKATGITPGEFTPQPTEGTGSEETV